MVRSVLPAASQRSTSNSRAVSASRARAPSVSNAAALAVGSVGSVPLIAAEAARSSAISRDLRYSVPNRVAQQVEPRTVAVAEIAPCAIQHEADQPAPIDVHRQRHRVVDADPAVVIVVERRVVEARERHRIADPAGVAAVLQGVVAHQRVGIEIAVEYRAVTGTDRARGCPITAQWPLPRSQHRQGRRLRCHQLWQRLDATAAELLWIVNRLTKRLQQMRACTHVTDPEMLHRELPAIAQRRQSSLSHGAARSAGIGAGKVSGHDA